MTLVITSISQHGIVMVADSAVTMIHNGRTTITNEARKLQLIPYLDAGISMWGIGMMPKSEVETDKWVEQFIENHSDLTSLQTFASVLATELQIEVGNTDRPLGMHVAGYIEVNDQRMPVLYHVRNVDGVPGNYKFHSFEESIHHPPVRTEEPIQTHITRNGNYLIYAHLFEAIENALPNIDRRIPHPSLGGQVRYHAAWIRFMSDIYDSADLHRSIGGPVNGITISPNKEIRMETFYKEIE